MLRIETKGSWLEMGRQLGETFPDELTACVDRYFYRRLDPVKRAPGIRVIEAILREHCPELVEETEGMAEAAGIDRDAMFGYRFFNEVQYHARQECSAIFLADTPDGSLLGRNCDLAPAGDRNAQIQTCRVRRPSSGPATIGTTYLGMMGIGVSEYGIVVGTASAHAAKTFGNDGLPAAVLCHLLLRDCRTVADATALFGRHKFLGKG